jgi:hypothetical protein
MWAVVFPAYLCMFRGISTIPTVISTSSFAQVNQLPSSAGFIFTPILFAISSVMMRSSPLTSSRLLPLYVFPPVFPLYCLLAHPLFPIPFHLCSSSALFAFSRHECTGSKCLFLPRSGNVSSGLPFYLPLAHSFCWARECLFRPALSAHTFRWMGPECLFWPALFCSLISLAWPGNVSSGLPFLYTHSVVSDLTFPLAYVAGTRK